MSFKISDYSLLLGDGLAQSVWCLTTYRMTGVRSPIEAKHFSSNLFIHTSPEAHPASYLIGTEGKARPVCDSDH
jgi:hypothetical protein